MVCCGLGLQLWHYFVEEGGDPRQSELKSTALFPLMSAHHGTGAKPHPLPSKQCSSMALQLLNEPHTAQGPWAPCMEVPGWGRGAPHPHQAPLCVEPKGGVLLHSLE